MPRKKKIIEKAESIKGSLYKVILDIGGTLHLASGDTIVDCFNQFSPDIPVKSRTFLTVEREGKSYRISFPILHAKRLLINKEWKAIVQKRFLNALGV